MSVAKKYDFVTILKFFAIVMIINSHAKWMYPERLQMLACGGAWGCSLFFFCSGFTMARMRTESFWRYVFKKVWRIYPAVWIWYALTWNYTDNFTWWWMLWPNYWFLRSILIYYILFYIVVKFANNYLQEIIIVGVGLTILCYIFSVNSNWMIDIANQDITKIYYFVFMLFGAYMRNIKEQKSFKAVNNVCSQKNFGEFTASIVFVFVIIYSFVFCYSLKFVCMRYEKLIHLQVLFPVILFAACYLFSIYFKSWKISNQKLKKILEYIAKMTLELYVVQQLLIYYKLAQPISGLGAICITLVCAASLHWAVGKLDLCLNKVLNINKAL